MITSLLPRQQRPLLTGHDILTGFLSGIIEVDIIKIVRISSQASLCSAVNWLEWWTYDGISGREESQPAPQCQPQPAQVRVSGV